MGRMLRAERVTRQQVLDFMRGVGVGFSWLPFRVEEEDIVDPDGDEQADMLREYLASMGVILA